MAVAGVDTPVEAVAGRGVRILQRAADMGVRLFQAHAAANDFLGHAHQVGMGQVGVKTRCQMG